MLITKTANIPKISYFIKTRAVQLEQNKTQTDVDDVSSTEFKIEEIFSFMNEAR